MPFNDSKVFVVDENGRPLLPTTPRRARLLLNRKKARVICVSPFTIQICRTIKNPVGEFVVGIDDGAVMVGLAIINRHKNEIVFRGEMRLRLDVKKRVAERAKYRRHRRGRLRNRPQRNLNRGLFRHFVAPSVRQRKDSIIRFVVDMKKRINIVAAVIEVGAFCTNGIPKGGTVVSRPIETAEFATKNNNQKALFRDRYSCQHCGSKTTLQVHHIKWRCNGGTNTLSNLITLCKDCHKSVHRGEWSIKCSKQSNVFPSWFMIGRKYLIKKMLETVRAADVVYGYMTKKWREELGLEKSHANDAVAMLAFDGFRDTKQQYYILARRKSQKKIAHKKASERNGFCSGDIIKALNRKRGYIRGIIVALDEKIYIRIRTAFSEQFRVTYNRSLVLWKPAGLAYI